MNQKEVFSAIYTYLTEMLNQYIPFPELSMYIVRPGLGANAGITGVLLLARQAIHES